MNSFRNKLNQFMYGRYGADKFGACLIIVALALNLIASIVGNSLLSLIAFGLMVYELYRMFSKNIVKRRIEEDKYQSSITIVKRYWKVLKSNVTDKTYHYYLCPDCHQMVRVPRGKGKVTITCPNCHKKFDKKS